MVTPISLEPPRPGDGSGICEYPETERDRYERQRQEAEAEYWAKKAKEARHRKRVREGFDLIFDNNAKE